MPAIRLALLLSTLAAPQDASEPVATSDVISFSCACRPEVQKEIDRGVWLLHSFWYEEALRTFQRAERLDLHCAAAFWGDAMTYNHPLWDPPSPTDLAAALAAAQHAVALASRDSRERGFAEAVLRLFEGAPKQGPNDRAKAYLDRMETLHAAFPGDLEVSSFYALALLGGPGDGFAKRRQAAAVLGRVLERASRHPGALHYLIHADDDRAHAAEALAAARLYTQVAPAIPHALHMPSHIYAQLGLWDDVIAANVASFAANEAWIAREGLGPAKRGWHTIGYLVYAYLQKGDASTVRALLELLKTAVHDRWTYRWAQAETLVTNGDWDGAVAFDAKSPEIDADLPPYVHGLGALWLGKAEALQAALDELRTTAKKVEEKDRTRHQIEVLELEGASAALRGDPAHALEKLAEAQETFEGTPGGQPVEPLVPPHELEGELLLRILHRPVEAARAFEASLRDAPGRRRSILGLEAARKGR